MLRTICIILLLTVLSQGDTLSIGVQPLGPYPQKEMRALKSYLEVEYAPAKVTILQVKEIPQSAWYAPRSRYRADSILNWTYTQDYSGYDKILAVTNKDISVTKGKHVDWGVIGLAYIGGKPAIVSMHRLQKKGVSYQLTLARYLKSCKHELGHTLGLGHCSSEGCVMKSYEGNLQNTDKSDGSFCRSCQFLYEMAR